MAVPTNNINLEAIQKTRDALLKGEFPEKREFIAEGEWIFSEDGQFQGKLEYPSGALTVITDQPPPMGGHGKAPNPVQYCVFAMAACYATTFMTLATQQGITVRKLRVQAKVVANMRAILEVEEGPVNLGVELTVEVDSDAPQETLEALRAAADEKCPAAYTVRHPVPFVSRLIKIS